MAFAINNVEIAVGEAAEGTAIVPTTSATTHVALSSNDDCWVGDTDDLPFAGMFPLRKGYPPLTLTLPSGAALYAKAVRAGTRVFVIYGS